MTKTRRTFVTLLLVALLICVTAGATVTASAATASHCTLSTSSASATVGQTITLSGTLASQTRTRPPISGAPVELYEQTGTTWTPIQGTVTTSGSPNFVFSVTLQEAGRHTYRVVFDGLRLAGPCASNQVTVIAKVAARSPTTVTISGPSSVHVGVGFTIKGKLAELNGNGLGRKQVKLYRDDGSGFVAVQSTQTQLVYGNLGTYTFQVTEPHAGSVTYRVRFEGNNNYDTSYSRTITVAVQKAYSTLSINAPTAFAQVLPWGTPYTVSGTLKDENGHPLPNKDIILYEYNRDSDKTVSIPLKTDPNGGYTSTQTKNSVVNYEYFAVFPGDSDYWSAQSATSSYDFRAHHTSLTAKLVSSGGSFAISGQLRDTDTGKGLAQMEVDIFKSYPTEQVCPTCDQPPLEQHAVKTDNSGFYKLPLNGLLVSGSPSEWSASFYGGAVYPELYDWAHTPVFWAPPA